MKFASVLPLRKKLNILIIKHFKLQLNMIIKELQKDRLNNQSDIRSYSARSNLYSLYYLILLLL